MKLALITSKLAALPMAFATSANAASFDITTVMSGAVDTTKTQMFSVLTIVVPAIVAVTAAVVGIKFGIGWLRKIKG